MENKTIRLQVCTNTVIQQTLVAYMEYSICRCSGGPIAVCNGIQQPTLLSVKGKARSLNTDCRHSCDDRSNV